MHVCAVRKSGQGVAHQLLKALEVDAIAHGCPGLLLETGPSQPEAISFYEKHGFQRRKSFGDYPEHPLSIFMGKKL